MLRTEDGDQLLLEEYAPVRESLLSHGHIKLRRELSLIVEASVRQSRIQQFRERVEGRSNFLPPSVVIPYRLTGMLVDALRAPVSDHRSSGIVGREAVQGFIDSYDQQTKEPELLN